jgi:beta-glucanase (GH16 family)
LASVVRSLRCSPHSCLNASTELALPAVSACRWLLPEGQCWPISGEIDIVEYWVGQGHNQHSRAENPAQMSSSYHYGFCCGCDLYTYPNDTVWWPSGNWTPNWPIIDFAADFHVFGVEINDTAIRYYVDNATNTILTFNLPSLCVTDPAFKWGKSAYMPFEPLYGIINTAVNELQGANLSWWLTNNATTLVDWVRWYTWQP